MKKQLQIFFDFLRFCIGSDSEIPSSLKEADWKELYAIAKKQCLVGILFDGIKKLPAEHVGMEKELLLQWMAESQMLVKANVRLNDAAIQVSEWFRKKGFRTCILKGQGNALMYPNPYSRTPGDIDIWVEGGDKRVISFVRSISPHKKACYHHIEFPSYKGVEVEVHYRPSFLLCFWHNRKLHSLLTNCRCYCLPSSHEGLPIALLEAMSYGVKVVVSDIPANLEVGLPKDDYFHCGNVDELSEKLGKIIEAPLQNVDYDMSKYDWDQIADEVGGVYQGLKK